MQIDSNADGLVDTTNDIPGLIKTSNGYYGLLSDTANVNVGNHKPFVMLESSAGVTWQPSLNYDISGIYDVDSVNGGSTTVVIEKSGSDANPFYQKWIFAQQAGTFSAEATSVTGTRLSVSQLIGEEQAYRVDLDGNGTIGDEIAKNIFLSSNQPSLVQTQVGDYALSFQGILGVNAIGFPVLINTSGNSWVPTRGNTITGVFAERSGSAQTVSIIENAGSSFSPSYKKWNFNLNDGSFFATATTNLSVNISSAELGLGDKKHRFIGRWCNGDPIKTVIVRGGENLR